MLTQSQIRRFAIVVLCALPSCQAIYPENTIPCQDAQSCPDGMYCVQPADQCSSYCFYTQSPASAPNRGASCVAGADSGSDDASVKREQSAAANIEMDAGKPADVKLGKFEVSARQPNPSESVEPRQALVVTFSNPVNWETVNEESFQVTLNGQPVPGDRIHETDTQLRFQPKKPLTLSLRYDITLAGTIKDRGGQALSGTTWWFYVRPGKWSPDPITDARMLSVGEFTKLAVSSSGNVAVSTFYADANSQGWKYMVMRRNADERWETLARSLIRVDDFAINDQGWVAIATEVAFIVHDEKGDQRDSISHSSTVATRVALSSSNELHMLDEEEGELVVKTRALGTVSSPSVEPLVGTTSSPITIGFARLDDRWYVAYLEQDPNTLDNSLWLSDKPADRSVVKVSQASVGRAAISGNATHDTLVAVWREETDGKSVIRASQRRKRDTTWREAQTISEPDVASVDAPSVVVDARGNAVAVWNEYVSSDMTIVRSGTYSPETDKWYPGSRVTEAMHTDHLRLAGNAYGQAVAAWVEDVSTDDDAGASTGYSSRSSVFDPEAKTWSKPETLRVRGDVLVEVGVGMADDGRAFVSWFEEGQLWLGTYQ